MKLLHPVFSGFGVGVAVLSACVAHADSYFIEDPAITGSYQDDATAFYELIRTAVSKDGRHEVIEDPSKADFVLRPKLLRLGGSYSAAIEKTKEGKTIFASQHKARSADELDEVTGRLVRSVIREVAVRDDVQVDDVTEEESLRGTRRRGVVSRRMFGFGPALMTENIDPASEPRFSVEAAYGWDLNSALLRIFTNWSFAGEFPASFLSAGIQGDYFFGRSDLAPFVGARLGYGGVMPPGGPFTSGFLAGAGGGLMMFRTSRVNLELAFRVSTLFHAVNDSLPLMSGLMIGLHY